MRRWVLFLLIGLLSGNFVYIFCAGGEIAGVVFSIEGIRLKGVKVNLRIHDHSISTRTDRTGHYSFSGLNKGEYLLVFSYRDYPEVRRKIALKQGQRVKLNVMMDLAQMKPIELLVTARKWVEASRDVPLSLVVLQEVELHEIGINDVDDLFTILPGLHRAGANADNILVVRGISSFESSLYTPTGVFIDDVALPIHLMQNPGLLDIRRVEVIKGPQATLYGRNTESGVINIITKRPANRWSGKIYGEYGSYRSINLGFGAEGILVKDKLFFRTAFQGARSDGYVENLFRQDRKFDGFEKRYSGRGILRWTPSSNWDISFTANGNTSTDGMGQVRFTEGPLKTDPHKVNYNENNHRNTDGNSQTLRVNYRSRSIDILSISSRQRFRLDAGGDIDLSPADFGKAENVYNNRTLSQELRISSAGDKKAPRWQLGVYAFKESMDVDTDWLTVPVFWGGGKITTTRIRHSGMALFGQLEYTLLKKIHLTVGIRLDKQDSSGDYWEEDPILAVNGKVEKKIDHLQFLPKLSLAYNFSPDVMGYVSVSKGFLAGGFKYVDVKDIEAFSYAPEYSWNYELGIKTSFLDRKLLLDASLFYIDIMDKQVFEFNPRVFANNIRNAASAHSLGIELDLTAHLLEGLTFSAGMALMESKFDRWTSPEYDPGTGSVVQYVYDGRCIRDAPRHTYRLNVRYSHPSGFFGGLAVIGVGRLYGNLKNTIERAPYQLINLSIGYNYKLFTVTLWCKNLLDKEFVIQGYEWGDLAAVRDGEPVRFGVTWTFRF